MAGSLLLLPVCNVQRRPLQQTPILHLLLLQNLVNAFLEMPMFTRHPD